MEAPQHFVSVTSKTLPCETVPEIGSPFFSGLRMAIVICEHCLQLSAREIPGSFHLQR